MIFEPELNELEQAEALKKSEEIVCQYLGITALPETYRIHYRNLDMTDNDLSNLAVLKKNDYEWIHRQAGKIGFRVISNNLPEAALYLKHSTQPKRFRRLVGTSLSSQSKEDIK